MPTIEPRQPMTTGLCLLALLVASCGGLSPVGIDTQGTAEPTTPQHESLQPTTPQPDASQPIVPLRDGLDLATPLPGDLDAETAAIWADVTKADEAGDRVQAVHLLQRLRARLESPEHRLEQETPESLQARMAMLETITIEMRKRAASQPLDAPMAAADGGDGIVGGP